MPRELPQVFAYIMPLRERQVDGIFSQEKIVVAKYLTKQSAATRFRQGTIIVFYESGKSRNLIGQGITIDAELMLPKDIISAFGSSFFLTEQELLSYVRKFPTRDNKKLLVIRLMDVFAYDPPVRWEKGTTMAGTYLTREEYAKLVKNKLKLMQ